MRWLRFVPVGLALASLPVLMPGPGTVPGEETWFPSSGVAARIIDEAPSPERASSSLERSQAGCRQHVVESGDLPSLGSAPRRVEAWSRGRVPTCDAASGEIARPQQVLRAGSGLEPEQGPFVGGETVSEYLHEVRRLLLADAPAYPSVRMVALPSFEPEWAVDVAVEGGEATVSAREAGDRIWLWHIDRAVEREPPALHVTSREIPKDLAIRAGALWWRALGLARFPTERIVGLDGTTFHFAARDESDRIRRGPRSAKAWSPDSGVAARLVSVGERLREVATSDDSAAAAALERLDAALAELEAAVTESDQDG